MTPDERWLAAVWPFVRASLPAAPAQVVEIGCGPLGGFVPMLEPTGYQATGVDPEAPPGPSYRQVEFELAAPAARGMTRVWPALGCVPPVLGAGRGPARRAGHPRRA